MATLSNSLTRLDAEISWIIRRPTNRFRHFFYPNDTEALAFVKFDGTIFYFTQHNELTGVHTDKCPCKDCTETYEWYRETDDNLPARQRYLNAFFAESWRRKEEREVRETSEAANAAMVLEPGSPQDSGYGSSETDELEDDGIPLEGYVPPVSQQPIQVTVRIVDLAQGQPQHQQQQHQTTPAQWQQFGNASIPKERRIKNPRSTRKQKWDELQEKFNRLPPVWMQIISNIPTFSSKKNNQADQTAYNKATRAYNLLKTCLVDCETTYRNTHEQWVFFNGRCEVGNAHHCAETYCLPCSMKETALDDLETNHLLFGDRRSQGRMVKKEF
jgi:hypothetical protein